LVHNAHRIELKGESMREKKRKPDRRADIWAFGVVLSASYVRRHRRAAKSATVMRQILVDQGNLYEAAVQRYHQLNAFSPS
jgi:hypothetical protein